MRSINFENELAELQDTLATSDFHAAINRASQSKNLLYLLVKVLQPIKIKLDANKKIINDHTFISITERNIMQRLMQSTRENDLSVTADMIMRFMFG